MPRAFGFNASRLCGVSGSQKFGALGRGVCRGVSRSLWGVMRGDMLRNSRGVVNFDSRRDCVSSEIKCETRRLCARCKTQMKG